MTRILFQRAASGFRTVRGGLIRRVQLHLEDESYDPGPIDGVYGDRTERALREWQAAREIPVSGAIDVATWEQLITPRIPPIFDRSLEITADFEGHGFGKVVGNFDGAWLTWGIIGFTLKFGSLQDVLNEILRKYPEVFAQAFGQLADQMQRVLDGDPTEQRQWANSISLGQQRYRVEPEWAAAFARLGNTSEAQEVQRKAAEGYWKMARRDAARFDLATELGFALCFDIAVQNGGVGPDEADRIERRFGERPPSTEQERRVVIANVVADASIPAFAEDVRSRKLTLATGMGAVHGARYAVNTWGLDEIRARIGR